MKKNRLFKQKVYTIRKDVRHHLIEWFATLFSVTGAILNAQLNIWGFGLFIGGNMLWIAFSVKHRHWGLFLTHLLFFALNLYGIYVWSGQGVL